MEVSVIIPTFNRREVVGRSLETLFAQNLASSRFEIIVVVDGSTDGTAEFLRALNPACRLRVIEQENRGPAAARNTGYRAAEADLVLFLDDDMLCDAGLVAAHLSAHRELARGVAFGALFLSADSSPGLAAECFDREIGKFHLEQKLSPAVEWQMTDCVFSNASLPRALLEEVGGFDESFRMREDLDLGYRLFRAGVRPVYVSSAIAYQHYRKTTADLLRDAEVFAAGDVLFARKYPEALVPGHLNCLGLKSRGKLGKLSLAARAPALADFLLAPLCGLGETFFHVPAIRRLGVRALQIRRRIHWFHKVLQLGWRPAGGKVEEMDS